MASFRLRPWCNIFLTKNGQFKKLAAVNMCASLLLIKRAGILPSAVLSSGVNKSQIFLSNSLDESAVTHSGGTNVLDTWTGTVVDPELRSPKMDFLSCDKKSFSFWSVLSCTKGFKLLPTNGAPDSAYFPWAFLNTRPGHWGIALLESENPDCTFWISCPMAGAMVSYFTHNPSTFSRHSWGNEALSEVSSSLYWSGGLED